MNMSVLSLILVSAIALIFLLAVSASMMSKNGPRNAGIKLNELPDQLDNCANGKTGFHFLGILTNHIDCIYFYYENDVFNLNYEAVLEEQLPYIERLKDYANSNQIKTTADSYDNSSRREPENLVQVLWLETQASRDDVVEIAREIEMDIFGNTDETVYQVVP